MAEEWTCGKGLAAHAPVPNAIGDMLGALAEMLDAHTRSLDLTDDNSRAEFVAYSSLVAQERMLANWLHSLANEMSGYETLPMGAHDVDVLMSPELAEPFQSLIDAENALLKLLTATVQDHEQMRDGSD